MTGGNKITKNRLIFSGLKIRKPAKFEHLKSFPFITFSAYTKSLASEQSRDIIFAALVPRFQIQTQTLTENPNPVQYPESDHTLTRSQTLTQPRNEAFSPV